MKSTLHLEHLLKNKKRQKFGNIKTIIGGHTFDSKKEAERGVFLKAREKAGDIRDLQFQPEFKIEIGGMLICKYRADFRYTSASDGRIHVEDVKSEITRKHPVYRIKKKLMFACHGIAVEEV